MAKKNPAPLSQSTINRLKRYAKAKGGKLNKSQTQAIMDMEEINKRGLSGKGTRTRKSKYGSKGKKFIGSTRSGEIVYEGQGRSGKRGKYYKRGPKGRVGAVSNIQGIAASRRGVPAPLGQRNPTIRSLAIPAQPPSANISSPPTRTGTSVSNPRLRRRTSITDQRPKVVGSGSGSRTGTSVVKSGSGGGGGILNQLRIPSSISSAAQKAVGFLRGKASLASLGIGAWDVGKYIGGVQNMGDQLKTEKAAQARAGDVIRMKEKKPPPVKAKVPTKSVPKKAEASVPKVNKKVVSPKPTPKAKGLSGFKKAFNVARYGDGGYEGKKFSYGGKSFIAVTKDDLSKRGMKSLGEWQEKQKASIKKLKKKGRTMRPFIASA